MIKQGGFSLLEMLVSIGLFSIAVMIIMISLFSIINAQKKSVDIQIAEDNLRFAFEAMTREIRTGENFHCGASGTLTSPQNCDFPNGETAFTLRNSSGQTVSYGINNSQMVKSLDGRLPCTYPDSMNPDLNNCQRITSPQVIIVDRIAFYVSGSSGGDDKQSRVTVVLEGLVQNAKVGNTQINLQTTVSKRGLVDQP